MLLPLDLTTAQDLDLVRQIQARREAEFAASEPMPLREPRAPERVKAGTRRESHIKHTKRRFGVRA